MQALSPNFEEVNQVIAEQSANARQMDQAMLDLTDGLQQTTQTFRETYQTIAQLSTTAQELHTEVSRFKVVE